MHTFTMSYCNVYSFNYYLRLLSSLSDTPAKKFILQLLSRFHTLAIVRTGISVQYLLLVHIQLSQIPVPELIPHF